MAKETSDARALGDKTQRIIASLKKHPDWTRKQHAESAGATVGRVGEVIRAGGVNYTAAAHAANVGGKKDLDAQLAKAEERVASLKAAIKERDKAAKAVKPAASATAKKAAPAKKAAIPELVPTDLLDVKEEVKANA